MVDKEAAKKRAKEMEDTASIMDSMLAARGLGPASSNAPPTTPPGAHGLSTAATNLNTAPPPSPAPTPEFIRRLAAETEARDARDVATAAAHAATAAAAATAHEKQLETLTGIMTTIVTRLPPLPGTPTLRVAQGHPAQTARSTPTRDRAAPPQREPAPLRRAHTAENLRPQFDATTGYRAPVDAPNSDPYTLAMKRMMQMAGLVYVNNAAAEESLNELTVNHPDPPLQEFEPFTVFNDLANDMDADTAWAAGAGAGPGPSTAAPLPQRENAPSASRTASGRKRAAPKRKDPTN